MLTLTFIIEIVLYLTPNISENYYLFLYNVNVNNLREGRCSKNFSRKVFTGNTTRTHLDFLHIFTLFRTARLFYIMEM
jgi:hypothetical protein